MAYGSSMSQGNMANIITGITPVEPDQYHFLTLIGNNITIFSLELMNCKDSYSIHFSASYIGYYFPDINPLVADV